MPGTAALAALGAAACGADYIKVGLHGPRTESEAIACPRSTESRHGIQNIRNSRRLRRFSARRHLESYEPSGDSSFGRCPWFSAGHCDKGRTISYGFYGSADAAPLSKQAHGAGLFIGLAGALRAPDLARLRDIGADIIGLRSAVCRNHQRNEPLDPERVRQLHDILVPVV